MKRLFSLPACLFVFAFYINAQVPVYLDDTKPIEERIEDVLSRMTLEEKVAMCHAQSKFSSPGVPRLGIPENWMTDGPHGIRPEVFWDEWDQAGWTNDSCIAFPALTCLAATWNPVLSALYGKAIGEEARYRNKNVLLGPGVNIYRTPLNGRNFEYMGEDPYLASQMVAPYVQGVQSNGVAACVKHFALNNQEVHRHTVNVNLSDRALHEIYLPAFKAAVREGGAWAIMGAYNLYKDEHACHNRYLLNDILRKQWGFDGVTVSDWGGVYNTYQSAYNGLDMEFGTGTNGLTEGAIHGYDNFFLAKPYLNKLQSGEIEIKTVDDKVRNILRLVFRTNMNTKRPFGSFGTPEHAGIGRQIAQEGIVLLKNNFFNSPQEDFILPIDLNKTKKIAVIGENAIRMMTVGGGSSSLKAKYEISPLQGLKNRVGIQAEIVYARGYVGEISGGYNGVSTGQEINDRRSSEELIKEAVETAKKADMVIFFGGLNKERHQDCEDSDRKGLELPYNQDKVIAELAKANRNLAVVIISGNAVAMPWVNDVSAILQAWYSGTEAGNAIASILVGDVNPSGKLPFTFGQRLTDYGAHSAGEYPGNENISYNEDIYVGYRWFDKNKIKPLFPFGHGLSYTTFAYGQAAVSAKNLASGGQLTVTVPVKNTGNRAGKEIVQLYIGDEKSSLVRPVKELKAFQKIALAPGEEKTVSFTISEEDLKFFDDTRHEWVAEPGKFTVYLGASSADIKSVLDFTLTASGKESADYMLKIRSHYDHQSNFGLDTYGSEKTDFWMASLDTYHKKYPDNLKRPAHIPNRVYLDRYIDAPHGSAIYWDLPSLVMMHNLSTYTGNLKYAESADNYVRAFLNKCVAPNGVFLWGNHYYYDAFRDSTVKFKYVEKPEPVDMRTEQGDLHEMRPLAPAWEIFWKIDSVATEKEIRQSVANHLVNTGTGQFNRHADGKNEHAFLEAGGVLIYSLAWLYDKTKDESLLETATKIAEYSYSYRDKNTGLLSNNPTGERWDAITATTEAGLWAGCLLHSIQWIPAGYAKKWTSMAEQVISSWLKYAFDYREKKYYGMLNISDGSPIKRTDDYPYKPDTYSDLWEPLFPRHDYPMSLAEGCLKLYAITGETKYKDACLRWIDIIKRELPARKGMGAYPEHYGRVIHFLLSCSEQLKDKSYFDLAGQIADEAVHVLYACDMFRTHPGENRYDAVDGTGILFLALMWLETGKKPDTMGLLF